MIKPGRLPRRAALGLLAVPAWSGLGVLTAPSAAACSCVGLDDRQAFDRADVVFTAQLVDRELDLLAVPNQVAVLTFEVDRVLKGSAGTRQGFGLTRRVLWRRRRE